MVSFTFFLKAGALSCVGYPRSLQNCVEVARHLLWDSGALVWPTDSLARRAEGSAKYLVRSLAKLERSYETSPGAQPDRPARGFLPVPIGSAGQLARTLGPVYVCPNCDRSTVSFWRTALRRITDLAHVPAAARSSR